jgi:hypothetical protein
MEITISTKESILTKADNRGRMEDIGRKKQGAKY